MKFAIALLFLLEAIFWQGCDANGFSNYWEPPEQPKMGLLERLISIPTNIFRAIKTAIRIIAKIERAIVGGTYQGVKALIDHLRDVLLNVLNDAQDIKGLKYQRQCFPTDTGERDCTYVVDTTNRRGGQGIRYPYGVGGNVQQRGRHQERGSGYFVGNGAGYASGYAQMGNSARTK